MLWWQTIFLSIIQGLTEFLPISSSGHLAISQKLFGLGAPVIFDVFLHIGTLVAIIIFLRKEISRILKGLFLKEKKSWWIFWLVVVGSLPAGFLGFFLGKNIEKIFASSPLIGFLFFLTGFLLLSSKFLKPQKEKDFPKISLKDAFFIGLFQAVAILPGISRSGSTIIGGLLKGVKREMAFQFSFFLAVPAILGALILQIPDLLNHQSDLLNQSLLGMILSGLIGYFSLKFLQKVLLNSKLWLFSFYCFFLGILIFILNTN